MTSPRRFYVVQTTLNPGVSYNVDGDEAARLAELGVLIGGMPAPATVMDSQLADLINDVNSLVHAAVAAFPPGPHQHASVDIFDSGSVGRALLAATATVGARTTLGLDQVNNTSDASKPVSTAQQTALNLKANLASPTFTGTVGGVTKAMVGLGSVDNTADAAKPVSTAQQTALNLKADADDPVFTGTVTVPAGALSIANTAGLQTALDAKANATVAANTQTGTAYTLVVADAGKAVEMNNAAANTLTIPPNSAAAVPVGAVIEVFQLGAGQTTVAAGAGVTLRAPAGAKLATQYATASLRKRAADEWVLSGSVTP